ncbi:hypothetical protein BSKO_07789 [Bryopsis sp. KO-2023]|nr:hypothetical protein BSKO_07789 [Bryopsis sp. KO-2023]
MPAFVGVYKKMKKEWKKCKTVFKSWKHEEEEATSTSEQTPCQGPPTQMERTPSRGPACQMDLLVEEITFYIKDIEDRLGELNEPKRRLIRHMEFCEGLTVKTR